MALNEVAALVLPGDTLGRRRFTTVSPFNRVATDHPLVGLLLATWPTYLAPIVFRGMGRPRGRRWPGLAANLMMISTYRFADCTLQESGDPSRDSNSATTIAQAFASVHNFPTAHWHLALEPIAYLVHFKVGKRVASLFAAFDASNERVGRHVRPGGVDLVVHLARGAG